jgi:hypothetical protein
MEMRRIKQSI